MKIENADILICFNCHKHIPDGMLFYQDAKKVYCEYCPEFKNGGIDIKEGRFLVCGYCEVLWPLYKTYEWSRKMCYHCWVERGEPAKDPNEITGHDENPLD